MYGFKHGHNKTIAFNLKPAEDLKEGFAFVQGVVVRFHFGAQPLVTPLDAALREYEEGMTTDGASGSSLLVMCPSIAIYYFAPFSATMLRGFETMCAWHIAIPTIEHYIFLAESYSCGIFPDDRLPPGFNISGF
ncbi:hypothetical protein B0H13DRAFT_1859673 [Mycena leptocephala]|nr:hypothetical protein B0H13DRAFT_1859673 [Mycena leptocephala]